MLSTHRYVYTVPLVVTVLLTLAAPSGAATGDFHELIWRQFEIYDPDYSVNHERYGVRLNELAKMLAQAQSDGRDLHCSQQMYLEAKWLHRYTAHWTRLEDKLKRIESSLGDDDQHFATRQLPTDGFWGICHDELIMRLSATLDGLENLRARGEPLQYRFRSPKVLDTAKKLLARLNDLLISDIANTGVNNRSELSSLITTLSQGVFKPHLREILIKSDELHSSASPGSLTEAFRFFLNGAQDPKTGYWGAWYIVDGEVYKSIDLSMTYHIIAYTKGRVNYWPQIIETTNAIEADPYPYGWRHQGHFNNHNLYDVAKIYKYGWPHMSQAERERTSAQIASMLEWSLSNSLDARGGIALDSTFSDSLADEYYFGVSFLDIVGYWQAEKRFWTDAPIDEDATAMCCRLRHRIEKLNLEGWAADGAMSKLDSNCSQC